MMIIDRPTANNGSVALIMYVTATDPWLMLAAVRYAPKKLAIPSNARSGPPFTAIAIKFLKLNLSPMTDVTTPAKNCRNASRMGDIVGSMFMAVLASSEYDVEMKYLRERAQENAIGIVRYDSTSFPCNSTVHCAERVPRLLPSIHRTNAAFNEHS